MGSSGYPVPAAVSTGQKEVAAFTLGSTEPNHEHRVCPPFASGARIQQTRHTEVQICTWLGAPYGQTHLSQSRSTCTPNRCSCSTGHTSRTPENTQLLTVHSHARMTLEVAPFISRGSSRWISPCTSHILLQISGIEWRREGEEHLKVTARRPNQTIPAGAPSVTKHAMHQWN